MRKLKNGSIYLLAVGVVLFGIYLFISGCKEKNIESFKESRGTFDFPGETHFLIGKFRRNTAPPLKYEGKYINEFQIESISGSYAVYIPSNELKSALSDIINKQVIVFGKYKGIPMHHLIEANPSVDFLKYVSSAVYTFFEAERIEHVKLIKPDGFYNISPPKRLIWNNPFELKINFKNIFDSKLETVKIAIVLDSYNFHRFATGHFGTERTFSLDINEEKQMVFNITPRKLEHYRGMPKEPYIYIIVCGYFEKKGKLYAISFRDEIVYNINDVLKRNKLTVDKL